MSRRAGKRRVLIDGAYGNGNIGDELLLHAVLRMVPAERFEVQVLSSDPADTERRHRVEALQRLSRGLRARGPSKIPGAVFARLKAIFGADVYALGGGSLITDERGVRPLQRYALLMWLHRLRRADVLLLGVGVGPLSTERGRRLARKILKRAALVWTRDEVSYRLASELTPGGRVLDGADLAFTLPEDKGVSRSSAIGVVVRDLPPSLDRDLLVGQRERFVSWMAELLDHLAKRSGKSIVFVPFSERAPTSHQYMIDDASLSQMIVDQMAGDIPVEVRVPSSPDEAFELLGRCELAIVERYHALVGCLVRGTPVWIIDYHSKVRALIEAGSLASVLSLPTDVFPDAERVAESIAEGKQSADGASRLTETLRAKALGAQSEAQRLLDGVALG